MGRDANEHVGEVADHVDIGQAAALDQRVDHRRGATAAHAAGEEPIAALMLFFA